MITERSISKKSLVMITRKTGVRITEQQKTEFSDHKERKTTSKRL